MPATTYPTVKAYDNPPTDWIKDAPRVTCPECGAKTMLARVRSGEHEGDYIIRSHQTPGDTHGCTPLILYDVKGGEARPRPMYREHGGAQ